MVYSTKVDVPTRVPGIATSQEGARGFVQRLVMQTVNGDPHVSNVFFLFSISRETQNKGPTLRQLFTDNITCTASQSYNENNFRNTSQTSARKFSSKVFDVLESQGRSALLPDTAISAILSQLNVNITYEPLECEEVAITRKEEAAFLLVQRCSCKEENYPDH
ncbi:hypothetical protein KIN20_015828 [Parelaphostrongylus tenuis]|uniref:Uncharacterized protein n=1 Tax=Parelaphostrongylus tenuis TaxID=148309 RepID=A0AAD5QMI0_PARTN|nr:hypothetical protein KIN20_015828 [Parelaphostrongylus tenuis]